MAPTQDAIIKLILQQIGGSKIKGAGKSLVAGPGREVIVKAQPLTELISQLRSFAGGFDNIRDAYLQNPAIADVIAAEDRLAQVKATVTDNINLSDSVKEKISFAVDEALAKVDDFALHTSIISGTEVPNLFVDLESGGTGGGDSTQFEYFANLVAGYANTAGGYATAAQSFAVSANSSAASANSSAGIAASFAQASSSSRGLTINGSLDAGRTGWTTISGPNPTALTDSTYGTILRSDPGAATVIAQTTKIPVLSTGTYRLSTSFVNRVIGANSGASLRFYNLNDEFISEQSLVASRSAEINPFLQTTTIAGSTFPAQTKYARPAFHFNDNSTSLAYVDLQELYFDDITEITAIQTFATAAQNSAVSANASAASASSSANLSAQFAGSANLAASVASNAAVSANSSAATAATNAILSASFGASNNLLPNSEFAGGDASGWSVSSAGGANLDTVNSILNPPTTDFYPQGLNVLALHQNGNVANYTTAYLQWESAYVPIEVGQYYQAHVLAAAHRAFVAVHVKFYTAAYLPVGDAVASQGPYTAVGSGGRFLGTTVPATPDLTGYSQISTPTAIVAPANAAYATVILRKRDTDLGANPNDSWAWFTRPYFGKARQTQTTLNLYTPGSGAATVSTLSSAVINATGQFASLSQRVASGSINLVENPSFERGGENWTINYPGLMTSFPTWGDAYFLHPETVPFGLSGTGETVILQSDEINIVGGLPYTLSHDLLIESNSAASYLYVDVVYYNSSNQVVLDGSNVQFFATGGYRGFSNDPARRTGNTVTNTPPVSASYAVVRLVAGPAGGTITQAGVRRIKLEQSTQATPYSNESEASFTAKTVKEHSGRLSSYLKLQTNAGSGATAYVELRADSNAVGNTSSVAIGAREIHLSTDVAGVSKKTLSLKDGNAEFSGGLTVGTYIRLGNGNQWNLAYQSKEYNATDGQVVNFGFNLGNIPKLSFERNNLAPLNNGEAYSITATNLTPTGFTLSAKINVPGVPVNYSKTAVNVQESNPKQYIVKSPDPDSVNSVYEFNYSLSGSVQNLAPGEPGQGTVEVSFWAMINGVWAAMGSQLHQFFGGFDGLQEPYYETFYETKGLGSNVEMIGMSINDWDGMALGSPPQLSLEAVRWQGGGTPADVRSATPNFEQTRILVIPQ